MPCMVSASRLIMRASPLTSSEPCMSQRLSMSPAASACATSPTVSMELRMECAIAQHHESHEQAANSAPPITHAVTTPDRFASSITRVSTRCSTERMRSSHRESRFRVPHAAARDRRTPRRCAAGVLAQIRFGAFEIFRGRLPQTVGDAGDFCSRFQRPGEIELRAQCIQEVCWPAPGVRPRTATRRRYSCGW